MELAGVLEHEGSTSVVVGRLLESVVLWRVSTAGEHEWTGVGDGVCRGL